MSGWELKDGAWLLKLETIQVKVHRVIGTRGWWMTTLPMHFNQEALLSEDVETAKYEALSVLRSRLREASLELEGVQG